MEKTTLQLAKDRLDDCKRQLEIAETEAKARTDEAYQKYLEASLLYGRELEKQEME